MRWPTLVATAAMTTIFTGCDKIPFIGGEDPDTQEAPQQETAADSTAADTTELEQAPALEQDPVTPPIEQAPVALRTPTAADAPWTPTMSGTVDPGMSRDQVIATWGEPASERAMGDWQYLYYRNGCELSCGTFDIVFLQSGQVVDAVVRWSGHVYSGISSSPPGRIAEFTPPVGNSGSEG